MRQINRPGSSIFIVPVYQRKNETDVTVSESPKAAMTLMSAAFTSSTGGRRREKKVKIQLWEGSEADCVDPDGPDEGTDGEGLMSGHWNTGCLKLTGRVFSGNS